MVVASWEGQRRIACCTTAVDATVELATGTVDLERAISVMAGG